MATVEGHAARMDGVYRGQRHIYDLTRKYYLLGRDRLIDELAPQPGAHVLEIGCGTGRNLIAAARFWPGAHFYGIDISEEMLKTARASIARAGLSQRIRVAQGDATDFDPKILFRIPSFDRIIQSYTLSMIPDWQARSARRCAICRPVVRCISLISASKSKCRHGSARRCSAGWHAFTSPRARCWSRRRVRSQTTSAGNWR